MTTRLGDGTDRRWREVVGLLPDGLLVAPEAGIATVKEIREMFGVPAGDAAQALSDSLDGLPYALAGGTDGPFTFEEGKVRFQVDRDHKQNVLRMDAMEAPV